MASTKVPKNVCGGFSEPRVATEEIQKYCDQVKAQVEGKTNKKYAVFKATQYIQQTVAGTNYVVKIHVNDHYILVRLFHELPCNGGKLVLKGVQDNHTKDGPPVPF